MPIPVAWINLQYRNTEIKYHISSIMKVKLGLGHIQIRVEARVKGRTHRLNPVLKGQYLSFRIFGQTFTNLARM